MRGTFDKALDKLIAGGIIPAYAGNIEPSKSFLAGAWDHPRVCGEHSL